MTLKKNASSTSDLKKKKKLNTKNVNFSIFKIEKNFRNPKFPCIFLNPNNQTQSWTSDMLDLLKSNQEQTQFFYFTMLFFPKWVKESNITSELFPFTNAVGNQEHPKNYGNGNGNCNSHLHLLLVYNVFLVDFFLFWRDFLVDLAIEKRKYFRCSRF